MHCCISVVKLGRVQDCAVFAELYRKLQGQVGAGVIVLVSRGGVKYTKYQIQIYLIFYGQMKLQQFSDYKMQIRFIKFKF